MTKAPPKVHARRPNDDEVKEIRRLVKKAGGEKELQSWIRFVCRKRGKGRPPGATKFADYDDRVLAVAELLSVLSRGRLSLNKILTIIATHPGGPLHWNSARGATPEAIIKRLYAKDLAERCKFNALKKPEIWRQWNEFLNWLYSDDDADLKAEASYLSLCRAEAGNHSD